MIVYTNHFADCIYISFLLIYNIFLLDLLNYEKTNKTWSNLQIGLKQT